VSEDALNPLVLGQYVDRLELPGLQAEQFKSHYYLRDCYSEDADDRKPDSRGKRLRFEHQD